MTPLESKIHQKLAETSSLTFCDFMEMTLYDTEFGYYTTHTTKIGRAGDFYTSSSLSEHFGELLAEQTVRCWKELGQPQLFTIVEFGAGTGHLAFDLLNALEKYHPHLLAVVRYVICERSPTFRQAQQAQLVGFKSHVEWSEFTALAAKPIEGLILSNEFVDALPIHRVKWGKKRLLECFVERKNHQLTFVWKPPSQKERFEEYLRKSDLNLREGFEVEISLTAIDWLRQVASLLQRGFVLTIDYGDLSDHLSEAPQGTARCFYQHHVNSDFLLRLGEQDMTADVNFSALMAYGTEFGLRTVKLDRQGDFLIGLGLLEKLESVTNFEGNNLENLKTRLALKHFLVPGGFGDHFKVLLQTKGL